MFIGLKRGKMHILSPGGVVWGVWVVKTLAVPRVMIVFFNGIDICIQ